MNPKTNPFPRDRWSLGDASVAAKRGWSLDCEVLFAGHDRKVKVHKIVSLKTDMSDDIVFDHVYNHAFYAINIKGLPKTRTYARLCMKALRLCCLKRD